MIVKNLNCRYLEIFSDEYQQLIFNNNLSSITIKAKLNEDNIFERTLNFPVPSKTWTKQEILLTDKMVMTGFYVQNVFTGLELNMLPYPMVLATVASIEDFKGIINNSFIAKFGSGVIQTSNVNFVDDEAVNFDYTISNLPYYIRVSELEYQEDSVLSREYFNVSSMDGISFGESSIILTPEFFDLDTESFSDGIVSINIRLRNKANRFFTDSVCFFIDCELKGLLPSIHNFQCVDQSTNIVFLHYTLTQASNTKCDCEDMYNVFKYVQKELRKLSKNIQDCGC